MAGRRMLQLAVAAAVLQWALPFQSAVLRARRASPDGRAWAGGELGRRWQGSPALWATKGDLGISSNRSDIVSDSLSLKGGGTLHSLQEINNHVEQLLRKNQENRAKKGSAHVADPGALRASQEAAQQKHTKKAFRVMVVIGRRLVRDQVSLEYASRLRTMVKTLRRMKRKGEAPQLLCFTGGFMGESAISCASAGYGFFRMMCEQGNVDLDGVEILLEEESHTTKEAVSALFPELQAAMLRGGGLPGDEISVSIVSSSQHVSRLEQVHDGSPHSSLLGPLERSGYKYRFEKASYPFLSSPDACVSFFAHGMLVVETLVPIRVNLEAASKGVEWFRRENFHQIAEAKRRINALTEDLIDSETRPTVEELRDIVAERKGDRFVDEVLDRCVAALSAVQDIVEPPIGGGKPVRAMQEEYERAALVLGDAIAEMREVLDPDRPLGLQEMMSILTEQRKLGAEEKKYNGAANGSG